MAATMLKDEFKAAFGLPFLKVLHDSCTTDSGKKGVIDSDHVQDQNEKFYGIAIEEMAQLTMSDTPPSAKKVSKLFKDFTPTDLCTVGGPFPEGAALIRKTRGLSNYFSPHAQNQRAVASRREVDISAFSKEGLACLKRIKGQITKRLPTITAESVVILLGPRTKFTVKSLIQPVFQTKSVTDTDENLALTLPAASSIVTIDAVMEEGKALLRNAL
ncbi:hypothetical protein PInf_006827 [Phytophthora infestans]|nr:hypothetical protein PInf_006827 [Phytophthora infestans]